MRINIDNLSESKKIFAEYIGLDIGQSGLNIDIIKSNNLFVKREENIITIGYSKKCEIFRGMALLKTELADGEIINQPSQFDTLSAFIDCSRNAVLKPKAIKDFILNIAALGYNELFLYTEDTFEIKEYSYFGHLRGRYSEEEIKDIDSFAKEYGVELIPAVQTLAHLNGIFHWSQFDEIHDTTDILLCDNEKTYEFIDKMLASLRRMYSTDKINIGMDEAHMLGLGKYLEENGYQGKMEIFLKHLSRVMELAEKNGFKKPMMWSDMFFKIACGKCNYEDLKAAEFSKETLALIPDNVILAYWNYFSKDEDYFDTMFKAHLKMGCEVVFTGGFIKWAGFAPNVIASFNSSRSAINSMLKNGIKKAIVSGWGDDGAECSTFAMLPGLALYSEKCYCDDMSDEAIDYRLRALCGYGLDDFKILGKANRVPGNEIDKERFNTATCKTILWNDPILGQYDKHIVEGVNSFYSELAESLKILKEKDNKFNYLFETLYYLCDFLSIKSEIGNKLYNAYNSRNKEELIEIKNTIPTMIEKLDLFHRVFRKNWLKENKIFGFDVQDIRFGAQRARLVYTGEVLEQYLSGEQTSIPELEENRMYFDCRNEDEEKQLHIYHNMWTKIVTPSIL